MPEAVHTLAAEAVLEQFKTTSDWLIVLGGALSVVPVIELVKWGSSGKGGSDREPWLAVAFSCNFRDL